jgi:hypothetical protein
VSAAADAEAEVAAALRWDRELARVLGEQRDGFARRLDAAVADLEGQALQTLRAGDPARVWGELVDWMQQRADEDVSGEVTRLATDLRAEAAGLAVRLGVPAPPTAVLAPERAGEVELDRTLGREQPGNVRVAVVSGALMGSSGVYTALGLLHLANPLLLATLPVVGATAFALDRYRDVRKGRRSQLEQRYTAEAVRFVRAVDKEARAAGMRLLTRARDGYSDHFREQVALRDRTTAEARAARDRALAEQVGQRGARLERARRELHAVDELDRRAAALAGAVAGVGGMAE